MSTREIASQNSEGSRAAWAGDPPQRAAARERLLDAAVSCIARGGASAASVSAVASEAGVSRPTVYRYFQDRNELVMAALLRAARRFNLDMRKRLERLEGPGARAVEAVLVSVREVPDDPVLGQIWQATELDTFAIQGFTSASAIALTRDALRPLVDAAGWDDEEADEAIEVLLRFVVSLLAAPEPKRNDAELCAFLERRMLPSLGLAGPGVKDSGTPSSRSELSP